MHGALHVRKLLAVRATNVRYNCRSVNSACKMFEDGQVWRSWLIIATSIVQLQTYGTTPIQYQGLDLDHHSLFSIGFQLLVARS